MLIQFSSLTELEEFIAWVKNARNNADALPETDAEESAPQAVDPFLQTKSDVPTKPATSRRTRRTDKIVADKEPEPQPPVEARNTSPVPVHTESAPSTISRVLREAATQLDEANAPELTEVAYLTYCKNFIAKHKLDLYNESFKKADLPRNITQFDATQRAKHHAILAALDATAV